MTWTKRAPILVAAALFTGIALAPPTAAADVEPLSGAGLFEIISVEGNGNVTAWRNVNGFNGITYPGPPRQVGSGWYYPSRVKFGDLDGDTYDEIISVDANGNVRAWRNVNGAYPGPEVIVGTGWTDPNGTFFADINGDGRDEIISFRANGEVWAWRNVSQLTWDTYREPPKVIGTGWNDPLGSYFADINGDNRDEIISLRPDGQVWAWRNVNGLNGFPYTAGSQVIGTGWPYAYPTRVKFADLNNDKRHEIISVDANGDVRAWRNVNGLNGFPYTESPKLVGTGWTSFRTFFAEVFI